GRSLDRIPGLEKSLRARQAGRHESSRRGRPVIGRKATRIENWPGNPKGAQFGDTLPAYLLFPTPPFGTHGFPSFSSCAFDRVSTESVTSVSTSPPVARLFL